MTIYISDECIVTEYEYTQEQITELEEKGFSGVTVADGQYKHEDFEKVGGVWRLK
jgi:hypothetical protein